MQGNPLCAGSGLVQLRFLDWEPSPQVTLHSVNPIGDHVDQPPWTKSIFVNKKVLLCERKRHTACRVASARYADPSGGGTPSQVWGGTLSQVQGGYPIPGLGGLPHPRSWGYPIPGLGGYPIPDPWGTPPPSSRPGWGNPPTLDLRWGTPPTI